MARYFFHTADGTRDWDQDGVELPDHQAARRSAIQFAGELLKHQPDLFERHRDFRVEVTNDTDQLLFTVVMIAIDAPLAATSG